MWFLIVTLFPNTGPLGTLTGHGVALLLYAFLFFRFKVKIADSFKTLLLFSVALSATIFISLLANHDQLHSNIGTIRYGMVPLYWLFGLVCGIIDTYLFSRRKRSFFFTIAAIFLAIQLPVVLLQLFGFDGVINNLWVTEKARDWTQIVRVVGTVQNPNTLGVLAIFCTIIFGYNLKRNPVWSKVFIVISFLIIVATGSRTSVVLLLLVPFLFISKKQLFTKKSLYIVLSAAIAIIAFYVLLLQLKEQLPYLSQILDLVSGGSVHTLETRFMHWESIKELYFSSPNKHQLFGFGPGYFPALDNSYFYVFFNYGIPAIVIFGILIAELMRISIIRNNKIALRCLMLLFISGFVADLMISFLFMTVIYYFLGFGNDHLKMDLKRLKK